MSLAKKTFNTVVSAVMQPQVLGTIFIGILGYAAYRKFTGNKDEQPNVNLGINQSLLSISNQQAEIYASQLYDSMEAYGTEEPTIEAIFNVINPEDFKLIYNKFGTVKYDDIVGIIEPLLGLAPKRDLVYILRSELSFFNPIVQKKVKTIVTQAGFAW
jgi:hypothetical protein